MCGMDNNIDLRVLDWGGVGSGSTDFVFWFPLHLMSVPRLNRVVHAQTHFYSKHPTQLLLVALILISAHAQMQCSSIAAEANSGSPLKYPVARQDSHMDDYHGEKVADPYRWMEQLDSPETREWVKAEAKLTDSYLEKVPVRKALKERLTQLLDFEKFGMPFSRGASVISIRIMVGYSRRATS